MTLLSRSQLRHAFGLRLLIGGLLGTSAATAALGTFELAQLDPSSSEVAANSDAKQEIPSASFEVIEDTSASAATEPPSPEPEPDLPAMSGGELDWPPPALSVLEEPWPSARAAEESHNGAGPSENDAKPEPQSGSWVVSSVDEFPRLWPQQAPSAELVLLEEPWPNTNNHIGDESSLESSELSAHIDEELESPDVEEVGPPTAGEIWLD